MLCLLQLPENLSMERAKPRRPLDTSAPIVPKVSPSALPTVPHVCCMGAGTRLRPRERSMAALLQSGGYGVPGSHAEQNGCMAQPGERAGMTQTQPKQSRHSPGMWCQQEGCRRGTFCPTGNMTCPGEAVACGKGIPAGRRERGVCEQEREKDFFGLARFAAERRFQLQG